jgi:hypothetical protein
MGTNGDALVRLWPEKRGAAEPPDYSNDLIVRLGVATEPLNRRWFERTTGDIIKDVHRKIGGEKRTRIAPNPRSRRDPWLRLSLLLRQFAS